MSEQWPPDPATIVPPDYVAPEDVDTWRSNIADVIAWQTELYPPQPPVEIIDPGVQLDDEPEPEPDQLDGAPTWNTERWS